MLEEKWESTGCNQIADNDNGDRSHEDSISEQKVHFSSNVFENRYFQICRT